MTKPLLNVSLVSCLRGLVRRCRRAYRGLIRSRLPPPRLPALAWGTKGFPFWTFLSLLLLEARPKRILELGSGRSTITLGEYCKSFGGLLISIETERDWYDKARFELGAMMLPTSSVKLLRIDQDTGWYDESSWASALAGETALDLVFVDAPNRHDGRSQGMRDSASALRLLKVACANASVVVIDDVHRAHILSAVDPMLGATSDFHKHFYDYQVIPDYPNAVCICTRKGTAVDHAISRIAELAGLVLYPDYLLQNCPEE